MWQDFRRVLRESVDFFLPPACLLCGRRLEDPTRDFDLCKECMAEATPLGASHCSLCAQPFPDASSSHLCGACLKRPPNFSRVHAACRYQGSIKDAVHKLKYRNQVNLARPLGLILFNTISSYEPGFSMDCIIPVPLHPQRLKHRGYNQAVEIARPLSRQLKLPMETRLLQRSRKTPPQQGLSADRRSRNLRNAFALAGQVTGCRVLLVDDIMTTGETVRECCRTLLQGGAAEIQVAVIARA